MDISELEFLDREDDNTVVPGNIITISDEQGAQIEMVLLDVIDYQLARYAVLIPTDESIEEVSVFTITEHEGQQEVQLDPVYDADVLNEVFSIFMNRNRSKFDFV